MYEYLFLIFYGLAIIITATSGYTTVRKKKTVKILKEAEVALNLDIDEKRSKIDNYIAGRYDGIKIRVTLTDDNGRGQYLMTSDNTLIEFAIFKLVSKSWSDYKRYSDTSENFKTLDETFDRSISCTCNQPQVLTALLNQSVRQKILDLNDKVYELNISGYDILIKQSASKIKNCQSVVMLLKEMIAISKDFSRPESTRERLIHNFNNEHNSLIRLKNLQLINRYFQQDDLILQVLKTALKDDQSDIVIEAAKHLGLDGMHDLLYLLKSKADLTPKQIIEIVDLFGRHKFTESIEALADLFQPDMNKSLYLEILKAFKAFGQSELSGFLLACLDGDDTQVQNAVIQALGTCGTIEAVERLYVLSKQSLNPFLRSTIQKSIARIQSRAGNAERGWLSVSKLSELDGALSHNINADDSKN